jgi:hypothetical protein
LAEIGQAERAPAGLQQRQRQHRERQQQVERAAPRSGGEGWPQQAGGGERQRILPHAGEQQRRQQRGADAAQHAAGREPQIEPGQVAGVRPRPGERAMADHRADEERPEMERQGQPEGQVPGE